MVVTKQKHLIASKKSKNIEAGFEYEGNNYIEWGNFASLKAKV